LDAVSEQQQSQKIAAHYNGACRNLNDNEISAKLASNEEYTIRLKVPQNETVK